jgi:hypothetical protein
MSKNPYSKYINWESVPEEVTHVRFEMMKKKDDYFICDGIEIIPRPTKIAKLELLMPVVLWAKKGFK